MSRSSGSGSASLPPASWPQRLAFGLLLMVVVAAAVFLAEGADVPSRVRGLRLWVIAGGGLFAMAPPNVLFPDSNVPLLQLVNWSPQRLLQYQVGRLGPLLLLTVLPAILIAYVDPSGPLRHLGMKTVALGQALLLLVGAAADSFVHFATLGPRSQAWQEGQAGEWYGRAVEERGQGVSLPRGLVPALFATTRCFVILLIALLLSAAGAEAGWGVVAWAPGLALLAWAGRRLWRQRTAFDRHFYQTTAFYDEVMGGGALRARGRDPIPYDAVYWVPSRWRASAWASLRQLDRRLPLGRLVALVHAGLWLLCLRGISPTIIGGYLALAFTAQTATCGLLARPKAAPLSFQRVLQSPVDWIATRFFVNLRWLGAHAGSLGLVALFSDGYGLEWVGGWVAVHIVLALSAAVVATGAHEGWRRKHAA